MKREVFFLIGDGERILWSDASTSPTALPDSRERWEAIWQHRDEIREIAHSHPAGGAYFSSEDETTMAALTSALGKAPIYSVVAPDGMIRREQDGDRKVERQPWWAPLLLLASGVESEPPSDDPNPSREEE